MTDESGETRTTTTTTTTENGVKTTETTETVEGPETEETETSEEPEQGRVTSENRRDVWAEMFSGGAEGTNEDGDICFMAWDNADDIHYAAIMILNAERTELLVYDLGEVVVEDDDWAVINDVEGEENLPFSLPETDLEENFALEFKDGDIFTMDFVDTDVILDDMVSIANSL